MMTKVMELMISNEFMAPVVWQQYPVLGSHEKLVRDNLGVNRYKCNVPMEIVLYNLGALKSLQRKPIPRSKIMSIHCQLDMGKFNM
jgi:hypothetical protein